MRTATRTAAAAALVVLGLALAPVAALPAAGATAAVSATIAHHAYAPNPLQIHTGDVVTWTNLDQAHHDVTTTSGPSRPASPELAAGQRWSFSFTTAGTYLYYCTLHQAMRGTVVVTAKATAPAAAPVGPAPAVKTPSKSTPAPTGAAAQTSAPAPAAPVPPPSPSDPTSVTAAAPIPITTTTTTSSGPRISPLLFLLAVVAGVVVFSVLAVANGPPRGEDAPAAGG
jgi:plastocyanin